MVEVSLGLQGYVSAAGQQNRGPTKRTKADPIYTAKVRTFW